MIYDYFYIKCVLKWSENSVRFENLMGIGSQKTSRAKLCEILFHSVRYGMNASYMISSLSDD